MKNTKLFAMTIAIIMLMACFTNIFTNVSFAAKENVTVEFTADADSNLEMSADRKTLLYNWSDGQLGDTFEIKLQTDKTTDIVFKKETIELESGGYQDKYIATNIPSNENVYIKCENYDRDCIQIMHNGQGVAIDKGYSPSLENINDANHYGFRIETVRSANNEGNEGGDQGGGAPAGGPDNLEFDIKFEDTHMIVQVNNMIVMDDEGGNLKNTFKGTINGAGVANAEGTNEFKFQNVFGDKPVIEYVINGVTYKEGDAGVVVDSEGAYHILVPGASKYTITGKVDENFVVPRTVIWVNPDYVPRDEEDAAWVKDFTVEHGYARVIEVYDENKKLLDPSEYVGERGDQYGLDDGFGWVQIFPGYRVVFEFVPEYGYQLTGIAINENPLEAIDDVVNRFEIILPDDPEGSGNLHFAATFTKTEDVVKANSKKVTGGEITLGKELDNGGTARLNVKDAELTEAKQKEFEDIAGDYTITDYLGLDLYQIYYKGKADDEDVWENKIEDLDKEATISIKLDDKFTADDIKILHNIHDGEEFEEVKIESYDKETNVVTFKTSSFSNYAIAAKGARIEDPDEPEGTTEISIKDLNSNVIITFEDSDGHVIDDFEFIATDITNMTDKQIAELGITRAEYEKGMAAIKDSSKKYGELILIYNIEVNIPKEDRGISEGPFTIRIPYTDALKGYESFKLAYVDDATYTLKETIELKLEDGYLVGTLQHLSPYALVGKVVEQQEETNTNTNTNTNTTNNPTTGDNIVVFTSIFVLSALAVAFQIVVIKKSK